MLNSPLVEEEISRRLGGEESKRINAGRLRSRDKQVYLKKELLERLEARYAENEGSLLLAKGVIEHIFETVSLQNNRRSMQEKIEKITQDDLKTYLVDYLLTDNHHTQMETAFSLYVYLSRNKLPAQTPSQSKRNPSGAGTELRKQ